MDEKNPFPLMFKLDDATVVVYPSEGQGVWLEFDGSLILIPFDQVQPFVMGIKAAEQQARWVRPSSPSEE